jgi:hypothetical protein
LITNVYDTILTKLKPFSQKIRNPFLVKIVLPSLEGGLVARKGRGFCVNCLAVTQWGRADRTAARFCVECWEVRKIREKRGPTALLSCLSCGTRSVLRVKDEDGCDCSEIDCKPCRLWREPTYHITAGVIDRRGARFENMDPLELADCDWRHSAYD